jgi:arginyl-tRNA synthetase
MQEFLDEIRAAIAHECKLAPEAVRLETPRELSLGDLAFPCFALAKERRMPPPALAAELAAKLQPALTRVSAAAAGPYVNFRVEQAQLGRSVIEAVLAQGARYGGGDEGAGRTIVLDLSSPNIAKPMSVGHLRSTVIGAALQRICAQLGYRTVAINHIGDWGAQFGKLVAAVQRWGATVDLEGEPIRALLALYVRYHEQEASDPALAAEARAAFQELESGVDGPVRALWRRLTALSMREFDKIYTRLGVHFDEVRGEAYYESHLVPTIERIAQAGVTTLSQGALIVELEEIEKGMPPCLLRKSDGTTLYATRDLAAMFHRHELYGFERCLYVVGSEQKLHFRQLKGVLRRMGLDWEPRIEHVSFGLLRLPEGRMSTREGRVIFLEEVLDRAVAEARAIIAEKNPELAGADAIAEAVGIGAIVFNDLKRERVKDVVFEWKEILSFEGETGPYVQYTAARLASLRRKAHAAGEGQAAPDWSALGEARAVLLGLGRYPQVLRTAVAQAEPSLLSQYLLALCRDINTWYAKERVLGAEPGAAAARLALADACKSVVASGLGLLGVASPEEM